MGDEEVKEGGESKKAQKGKKAWAPTLSRADEKSEDKTPSGAGSAKGRAWAQDRDPGPRPLRRVGIPPAEQRCQKRR